MARQLSGLVIVNGTDDESWPFDDERTERTFPIQSVLDVDQPAVRLSISPVRWGGECRVELDLTAQAVGNGEIQIQGEGRLYEGTSENTDDLEDRKTVTFLVPRNTRRQTEAARHEIHLNNSGAGGGDHAEVYMSFTNYLVEDD